MKSITILPWYDGGYETSLMLDVAYWFPRNHPVLKEEIIMMREQIWQSEGFDIDFDKFRCPYTFVPVDLDDADETDEVLLVNSLSKLALEAYNEEKETKVEFHRVLKAHWYPCAGLMYYITFEVFEDNRVKEYQAMVRYLGTERVVYLCRPKPCKDVIADCLSLAVILLEVPPKLEKPSCPKRQKMGYEEDKHHLSVEEECEMMKEQVSRSEGFDIDFDNFRCEFNFRPVRLDRCHFAEAVDENTERDLMNSLSKLAVETYNKEKGTKLEFKRVVKANWRASSGCMFYITFEACEYNQVKEFQTLIRFSYIIKDVFFCRPKPYKRD